MWVRHSFNDWYCSCESLASFTSRFLNSIRLQNCSSENSDHYNHYKRTGSTCDKTPFSMEIVTGQFLFHIVSMLGDSNHTFTDILSIHGGAGEGIYHDKLRFTIHFANRNPAM